MAEGHCKIHDTVLERNNGGSWEEPLNYAQSVDPPIKVHRGIKVSWDQPSLPPKFLLRRATARATTQAQRKQRGYVVTDDSHVF